MKKIWYGLVLFPLFMQAQETIINRGKIGLEFGSNGFWGETIVPNQVRASNSAYQYDDFYYDYPDMNQVLSNIYGGIKYESFFYKNRLGLAVGLRFSQFSSEMNASGRNQKYFAWLLRQDELTTDYLMLQKIEQKNYYLGIPLELRYFFRNNSFFSWYFKLGTTVNYCLSTNNTITFNDSAMEQYTGAIEEQIDKPSLFNALVYPAWGFKLGNMKSIWGNIEIHLPGFLIGKKAHPFVRQDAGMGIQLSVQIPLNKITQ